MLAAPMAGKNDALTNKANQAESLLSKIARTDQSRYNDRVLDARRPMLSEQARQIDFDAG